MASPADIQDAACSSDGVLFITFNQDYTALAVGKNSGYCLYDATSIKTLDTIYDNEGDSKDVCLIERLFSSSLLAIVNMTAPRELKVCHFKKGSLIKKHVFIDNIVAVRISRQRLVVVFEESLNIHDLKSGMVLLHNIRDTPPNPKGICAVSTNKDMCFLAYPGCALTGEVQIYDATNLKAVASISAHNGPLATLAFDSTATKLATASVKGTVIRVFSIPEGQLLFQFRRGLKRCVEISSLAFSSDSTFLCSSSNTETVHIFKLIEAPEKELAAADDDGSWSGYLSKVVTASVNYLPTQVSSMLDEDRAFATAMLPVHGTKTVCAIVTVQKAQYVMVACYNGYVYIYKMDSQNGGACELIRQQYILADANSHSKETSNEYGTLETNAECKVNTQGQHEPRLLGLNADLHYEEELSSDGD